MLLFFLFFLFIIDEETKTQKIKCLLRSLSAPTKQKPVLLAQAPAAGSSSGDQRAGQVLGLCCGRAPIPAHLQVPAGLRTGVHPLRKCLGGVERAANLCQSQINQT